MQLIFSFAISFLLFTSISTTVFATDFIDEIFDEETLLSNSITLGISNDSSNSKTYDLDIALSLNKSTLFTFYSEYSDINDPSIDFDSKSIDLGIRYQVNNDINLGVNYIDSGQKGHLTTKTLRGTFSYYSDNWDFSIIPETSSIQLSSLRRKQTQTGLGINMNYYGISPIEFSFSYAKYKYSRDPRLIKHLFIYRIVTIQTLSLANNFYDNYYTAGLKYNFDKFSTQYSYSQSLSAVDSSISKSHSLNFSYSPVKYSSLYLTIGSNQQENLEKSQFLRIAMGYHW